MAQVMCRLKLGGRVRASGTIERRRCGVSCGASLVGACEGLPAHYPILSMVSNPFVE